MQSLLTDLADIAGQENLSTREADLALYGPPGDPAQRPRAVVCPDQTQTLAELLRFTRKQKLPVTLAGPRARPAPGGVVLDLKRLSRIRHINPTNLTCEVEVGITGDQLEKALAEKGLTLGYLPASLTGSTVGAWLAGRPAGLSPSRLGQAADLVVSLEGVLPDGTRFRSRATPRSAAGPDLDQVLAGSGNTLAVITAAVLAVARQPELKRWRRFLLAELEAGLGAMRAVVQKGLDPVAARLEDGPGTRRWAGPLQFEPGKAGCLLTLGFEGPAELTKLKAELGAKLCRELHGEDLDEGLGVEALKQRDAASRAASFAPPGAPAILDTIEFGAPWANLLPLYQAVQAATGALASGFAHFAEPLREGAGLRFTFAGEAVGADRLELVKQLCAKASEAGLRLRAAVSHPGLDPHPAQWSPAQHGAALDLYRGLKHFLDPDNLLNPGQIA